MAYGTDTKGMVSMIRSLFTYGGLSKDSSYLAPYKENLSEDVFNKIYDETSKDLEDNYQVIHNVYTDSEGCTYNQLVKVNEEPIVKEI